MGRVLCLALTALVVLPACRPWNRDGDYYAGPVDPAPFPAEFKGDGYEEGVSPGQFVATSAWVAGEPILYYRFSADTRHLDLKTANPLQDRPLAYVFDANCKKPDNYVFDQQRDFVRFDEQGTIFTALPSGSYRPIVAEVQVVTNMMPCQAPKAHEDVVDRSDVMFPAGLMPAPFGAPPPAKQRGIASGTFYAWAIIDPSAKVLGPNDDPLTASGVGRQKWGWFDHYLVAYIDGGQIPTDVQIVPGMMGNPDTMKTVARTQNLYYPANVIDRMSTTLRPGVLGEGFDILQFKRGDPNYSPICKVFTYTPSDPSNPPRTAAQVDLTTATETGEHVYCMVQP